MVSHPDARIHTLTQTTLIPMPAAQFLQPKAGELSDQERLGDLATGQKRLGHFRGVPGVAGHGSFQHGLGNHVNHTGQNDDHPDGLEL